ncbi:MAG: hypothetical protein R2909_00400 [Gemmatimonadales bacterium]
MSLRLPIALTCSLLALPAVASGQGPFPAPIGVRIPVPPTPVEGMGQTWLGYELHLSNFAPVAVSLAGIEVFADQGSAPVATWSGSELQAMRLGAAGQVDSANTLARGGFDVVFVWLPLPAGSRPASLRHVVTVRAGTTELAIDAAVPVNPPSAAPVFGPPLKGDGWIAAFGPADPNGHQRTILPTHGRAAIVQRCDRLLPADRGGAPVRG